MEAVSNGKPLENIGNGASAHRAPVALDPLTPRELEVLQLMSQGLTTKEIAAHLDIAFKTVACHRSRILSKLGVRTTVAAIRWAVHNRIVEF